jgi:hypothetical protein
MPIPPNTRVSWGQVGRSDQWYLPGTDVAGLPAPDRGGPSDRAFLGSVEGLHLDRMPAATWGGLFSVVTREVAVLARIIHEGRRRIRRAVGVAQALERT